MHIYVIFTTYMKVWSSARSDVKERCYNVVVGHVTSVFLAIKMSLNSNNKNGNVEN